MYFVDKERARNKPLARHKVRQYIQIDVDDQAFVYDLEDGQVLTPELQRLDKSVNILE